MNMNDFVVRYEFMTPVFSEGIMRLKGSSPMLADIFQCTPIVDNSTYCEEEAMWALIDTIRVEKPEDFNRPQQLTFLGDDELAYTMPNKDMLCWKHIDKYWIFWVLCRYSQPEYENNDFSAIALI